MSEPEPTPEQCSGKRVGHGLPTVGESQVGPGHATPSGQVPFS